MTDQTRQSFEETLQEALQSYNEEMGADKEKKLKELQQLSSIINESDTVELDAFDKQEKRRIDEIKNKSLADIEEKKIKQGWIKVAVEAAIAVGLTVFEVCAHRADLRDVTKFEENGRYNSSAFRLWQGKKPRIRK